MKLARFTRFISNGRIMSAIPYKQIILDDPIHIMSFLRRVTSEKKKVISTFDDFQQSPKCDIRGVLFIDNLWKQLISCSNFQIKTSTTKSRWHLTNGNERDLEVIFSDLLEVL